MRKQNKKYIFVTGGVLSGIGKGIAAASIGALLKENDYNINFLKIDGYLNIDPGTMNPIEHGEVYVTCDGYESDLDLGHYERFLDIETSRNNNLTMGQVYYSILQSEREGNFLGKTVQIIPHVTDIIKNRIIETEGDIVVVELGGTIGDIESLAMIEAIRQMSRSVGKENVLFVHLVYVPYLENSKEVKTKPCQQSVSKLRELGIAPDILICRVENEKLNKKSISKISCFCDIDENCVIEAQNVDNIYKVIDNFHKQSLDSIILHKLNLMTKNSDISKWKKFIHVYNKSKKTHNVALIGKYSELSDSYKSIIEAINHACVSVGKRSNITIIDSKNVIYDKENLIVNNNNFMDYIKKNYIKSIVIPGGFGDRGIEGKINICKFARENNIPLLGICLGMQCMVIEYARNNGHINANSTEFDKNTDFPIVDLMDEQKSLSKKGGTMRLGNYECKLLNGKVKNLYNSNKIVERHRHRYEVNIELFNSIKSDDLSISGLYVDKLPEIVEHKTNRFYVGCQFHPEFKSRPFTPHPLFLELIREK